MSLTNLTVACIGLGRMGSGIARNIQAAGPRFIVYNRTADKAKPFVAAGARAAATPCEAVAEADFVVTNLMDDKSVVETVVGNDGILAGLRPNCVHIGTTTISPSLGTQLAELHTAQGSHYVSAPVAGRPEAAAAGKLLTFVAGDAAAVERSRPVLQAYTARIFPMGADPAVALSMKLVGNFMVASIIEMLGQTYVFAEQRGLDPEALGNIVKTFFPLPNIQEYSERIRTRDFGNAGFTLDAGLKDVRLMLDAAAEVHTPLPYASLIRDKCIAAIAQGMGQSDWSTLTEISRLNAGQPKR